jgi:hypothetical protein
MDMSYGLWGEILMAAMVAASLWEVSSFHLPSAPKFEFQAKSFAALHRHREHSCFRTGASREFCAHVEGTRTMARSKAVVLAQQDWQRFAKQSDRRNCGSNKQQVRCAVTLGRGNSVILE